MCPSWAFTKGLFLSSGWGCAPFSASPAINAQCHVTLSVNLLPKTLMSASSHLTFLGLTLAFLWVSGRTWSFAFWFWPGRQWVRANPSRLLRFVTDAPLDRLRASCALGSLFHTLALGGRQCHRAERPTPFSIWFSKVPSDPHELPLIARVVSPSLSLPPYSPASFPSAILLPHNGPAFLFFQPTLFHPKV